MFRGFFKKDGTLNITTSISGLSTDIWFKTLALNASENLIANAIVKSEFKTFEKGTPIREALYYSFNIEPNPNQSASVFWKEVVHKLLNENECLVLHRNDHYYIADSFFKESNGFTMSTYKDVSINGETIQGSFTEDDVWHFKYQNEKNTVIINGIYANYSKLIAIAQKSYKEAGVRKGKLKIGAEYPKTIEANEKLKELINEQMRVFYQTDGNATLPLSQGLDYEELSNGIGVKGGLQGRDIRAFIDDVIDMVAIARNVPPKLLKGDVADTADAVNNLLTFCVNPLAEMIADEINRKSYGKHAYLERTYLKVDTTNIKAVDIKQIASSLDILTRIGAYNVDECLMAMGKEPLNTEWSTQRFMTKNYQPIDQMINNKGKGGGK